MREITKVHGFNAPTNKHRREGPSGASTGVGSPGSPGEAPSARSGRSGGSGGSAEEMEELAQRLGPKRLITSDGKIWFISYGLKWFNMV